ncbi:hypothetical protein ACFQ0T_26640 [Kitasatospora gansuensis]
MSRPTIAQLLTGTLTVVAAAAVLLAVSGSRGCSRSRSWWPSRWHSAPWRPRCW